MELGSVHNEAELLKGFFVERNDAWV